MVLEYGHAANVLVTPPSRDNEFSTALVDAHCTSLWTSLVAPFADKYLAHGDEYFDNCCDAYARRVFSTAAVDVRWVSLWISVMDALGDSDL